MESFIMDEAILRKYCYTVFQDSLSIYTPPAGPESFTASHDPITIIIPQLGYFPVSPLTKDSGCWKVISNLCRKQKPQQTACLGSSTHTSSGAFQNLQSRPGKALRLGL